MAATAAVASSNFCLGQLQVSSGGIAEGVLGSGALHVSGEPIDGGHEAGAGLELGWRMVSSCWSSAAVLGGLHDCPCSVSATLCQPSHVSSAGLWGD